MAKKLISLMRGCAGETLVETLCSILVCALSVAALSVAVAAATHMNQSAQRTSDDYREVRQQAETQAGAPTGTTTITVDGVTYDVSVYGGDGAISYELA